VDTVPLSVVKDSVDVSAVMDMALDVALGRFCGLKTLEQLSGSAFIAKLEESLFRCGFSSKTDDFISSLLLI
jgi:hypothetical protein